jgi:hypothetical protein
MPGRDPGPSEPIRSSGEFVLQENLLRKIFSRSPFGTYDGGEEVGGVPCAVTCAASLYKGIMIH